MSGLLLSVEMAKNSFRSDLAWNSDLTIDLEEVGSNPGHGQDAKMYSDEKITEESDESELEMVGACPLPSTIYKYTSSDEDTAWNNVTGKNKRKTPRNPAMLDKPSVRSFQPKFTSEEKFHKSHEEIRTTSSLSGSWERNLLSHAGPSAIKSSRFKREKHAADGGVGRRPPRPRSWSPLTRSNTTEENLRHQKEERRPSQQLTTRKYQAHEKRRRPSQIGKNGDSRSRKPASSEDDLDLRLQKHSVLKEETGQEMLKLIENLQTQTQSLTTMYRNLEEETKCNTRDIGNLQESLVRVITARSVNEKINRVGIQAVNLVSELKQTQRTVVECLAEAEQARKDYQQLKAKTETILHLLERCTLGSRPMRMSDRISLESTDSETKADGQKQRFIS